MKKSNIYKRYCSLFLLIELLLFLFQSLNGIISFWGIVPAVITLIVFINIVKNTSGKPKYDYVKPKILSKINIRKNALLNQNTDNKTEINNEKEKKKNAKKPNYVLKIVSIIVFFCLGVLFLFINSNTNLKNGEKIVNSKILSQEVYSNDINSTNTVEVSYNFNNEEIKSKLYLQTNIIHKKTIKIVVDSDGLVVTNGEGFSKTPDYLNLYLILAIIMFICLGVMLLNLVLKKKKSGLFYLICFALGACLTFGFNSNLFANILFYPLTSLSWCLMSIGLYGIFCSFFAYDK